MTITREHVVKIYHALLPDEAADDVVLFLEDAFNTRVRSGQSRFASYVLTGIDAMEILVGLRVNRLRVVLQDAFIRPASRNPNGGKLAWCREYAEASGVMLGLFATGAILECFVPSLFPPSHESSDLDFVGLVQTVVFLGGFTCGWLAFARGEFALLALFFLYCVSTVVSALILATSSFVMTGAWPDPSTLSGLAMALIKAFCLTLGGWKFHRTLKLRTMSCSGA